MKIFNLIILCLFVLTSCSKPEKPKLTVSDYDKQAVIMKGVIEKIMVETDYNKMHEIAMAVESSRAVDCVPIGQECNIYGQILNRIVQNSKERLPDDTERVEIYKKVSELDQTIREGREKLAELWREYMKVAGSEEQ